MNLFKYLGIDADKLDEYVDSRLIDRKLHDEFPLALLCYGRKAVYDNIWDSVTTKCRGLIYNTETFEIVSRPFEKFFNWGDTEHAPQPGDLYPDPCPEPEIYEKMDGFLCILYTYNGQDYIASKGSFHSIHAKWATKWYQKHRPNWRWRPGFTPVFEGLMPNLRIVVDYGKREGLTLLALIDNETGEEVDHDDLCQYASLNSLSIPEKYSFMMEKALKEANTNKQNFEGYVLVWRRPEQTPFRLKVKYLTYLKLHRLVTQTSPKRILEALEAGWMSELDEWTNETTVWFSHFICKWRRYLESAYKELAVSADAAFIEARKLLNAPPFGNELPTRKQWAEEFSKTPDLAPILFALLDGKDANKVIWKRVKPLIKDTRPLVDSHL
jgi:RNA ligase